MSLDMSVARHPLIQVKRDDKIPKLFRKWLSITAHMNIKITQD